MSYTAEIGGRLYEFNHRDFHDISIPLRFNGPQPNAYGVESASSAPCKTDEFVGDTREGGSCNFESYSFIPHCNGTHTECIGHITHDRISLRSCLKDIFIPASLISVLPKKVDSMQDSYESGVGKSDKLITRASLENARISDLDLHGNALVLRTLPNEDSKLTMSYGDYVPPYISDQAMDMIVGSGVKHLLVDLPSIDRIFDGGNLSNHRKFWGVKSGDFEPAPDSRLDATITELIYAPNEVKDGLYLLNLQIAAFESDASPSRPILLTIH